MNTGFHFAYKKAAQALNFFAIQHGGEIEKLHFLDDPPPPVNPCHALTPEERRNRQEQLKEMADAVALWR
jgi:hypothetical protein